MSDVSVDIIKNRSGEAPDLPSGANLSGVSTAATLQVTNLNPTHINASGVTTATTFSGSFKSTSTPTLGLGVTINSSGLNISGVATAGIVSATTLYGDGSNLTGVAMSIAPISYQPDVNDTLVTRATSGVSIGMTFTERVIAGSGNVTLRIAGAAGTVVENFGVGSSVTISNNEVSVSPTAALLNDTVYHINYPSGSFTNTGGDVSYVGTAYTFTASPTAYQFWTWGQGIHGALGQNESSPSAAYSSPVQIPGTTWSTKLNTGSGQSVIINKTDGTLWSWGYNWIGQLGHNNRASLSSPVQVGSDATWAFGFSNNNFGGAIKTDGTIWGMGKNYLGMWGSNQPDNVAESSPVQIMGSSTGWSSDEGKVAVGYQAAVFIKADGTIWGTGASNAGMLGHTTAYISSPVQVSASTNWSQIASGYGTIAAIKTDGTLWNWGENEDGMLGQNSPQNSDRSSPVQIPGTNWTSVSLSYLHTMAVNTSGELWTWGKQSIWGNLGVNDRTEYSSPVQVPGTNWSTVMSGTNWSLASKTDGTAWAWGRNHHGQLGLNNITAYSSPVQLPGTNWNYKFGKAGGNQPLIIKEA